SGDNYFMQTRYVDATGGQHPVDNNQTGSGFVATSYRAVPADRLAGGISNIVEQTQSAGSARTVTRAFKSPIAQALTLPAPFQLAAGPRLAAVDPYPIVEATLTKRGGASYYQLRYSRSSPATNASASWILTYSAAWADLAGDALVSRTP